MECKGGSVGRWMGEGADVGGAFSNNSLTLTPLFYSSSSPIRSHTTTKRFRYFIHTKKRKKRMVRQYDQYNQYFCPAAKGPDARSYPMILVPDPKQANSGKVGPESMKYKCYNPWNGETSDPTVYNPYYDAEKPNLTLAPAVIPDGKRVPYNHMNSSGNASSSGSWTILWVFLGIVAIVLIVCVIIKCLSGHHQKPYDGTYERNDSLSGLVSSALGQNRNVGIGPGSLGRRSSVVIL